MFSKIKLRKAPLTLSSVSNAIKSSGNSSLTPEMNPKQLKVASGDQFGLPTDSIEAIAYDPVQSLLAVATRKKAVHVYGQNTVEVVFELDTRSEIAHLRFLKGVYLVCIETSGTIIILSLHSKKILSTYLAPGVISSVETDPSMDWLVFGLVNGSIFFYDVDRLHLTPIRVDNLQKIILPKQKLSPVKNIEWHPRDIGTLLITYNQCVVQYSITSGGIRNSFVYTLEPGSRGYTHSNNFATGGKKKLFGSPKPVICETEEAHYHPNGLHIVTIHTDGSFVFWDANDGTLLEARSLKETSLHKLGGAVDIEQPFDMKARWIAGQDPEETSLLITGASISAPERVDILDFGYTLKYSLTSHEKQGAFYGNPQGGKRNLELKLRQSSTPDMPHEGIRNILAIPGQSQPYFNGCHNPSMFFFISTWGALYLTDYSGSKIPKLSLPPSISMVTPPVTYTAAQRVKKVEWFGVLTSRKGNEDLLLKGGAAANKNYPKTLGADENYHTIFVTGHQDGSVKFLDMTSGEFHDNEQSIQLYLQEVLYDGISSKSYYISNVSCSFESRELLVGLATGNVAICKFMKLNNNHIATSSQSKSFDLCPVRHENGDCKIRDISKRLSAETMKLTFEPSFLLDIGSEDQITCLKMSGSGFGAVGYKSGRLVVMDITRGPAIILNLMSVKEHLPSIIEECFVTSMEFAVMEYGEEGYSSLILIVGTNAGGNLILFKIVPQQNGGFQAVFADKSLGLNYKNANGSKSLGLNKIIPISASNGQSLVATLELFRGLGQSRPIPGYIIVGSARDIRVLKVPKQKLARKVVDESCITCGVINMRVGSVLAAVTESGFAKLFSLPSLSETNLKIPDDIFKKLKSSMSNPAVYDSVCLNSGEILFQLSKTEVISLLIFDETKNKTQQSPPTDLLFNENAVIPPRPSASALLWAKGQTAYTTPKDLALLIAGPNRRPAMNEESQLAYNISPEANHSQSYGSYDGTKPTAEPYAQPNRRAAPANPYGMSSQGFMRSLRDGLDSVEENVNGYASGISEAMNETLEGLKRSFYSLALQSKFGF